MFPIHSLVLVFINTPAGYFPLNLHHDAWCRHFIWSSFNVILNDIYKYFIRITLREAKQTPIEGRRCKCVSSTGSRKHPGWSIATKLTFSTSSKLNLRPYTHVLDLKQICFNFFLINSSKTINEYFWKKAI